MPSFCRHNRFESNCPICAREKAPELAKKTTRPGSSGARRTIGPKRPSSRGAGSLRVRREVRAAADGYTNELVPGVRSSADAVRLANEIAFSAARLEELAGNPPGLYAAVRDLASGGDLDQALWLAFLLAYVGPGEGDAAFASIAEALTVWTTGEVPDLEAVTVGPRTSHAPGAGSRTLTAYRAWAERGGGQHQALLGEAAWAADRRFSRTFERLGTVSGLARGARFDFLVTLDALGVMAFEADALGFTDDQTTIGAKRVFGIGDSILLERRSVALADALGVRMAALDLALHNWSRPPTGRATMGASVEADPDVAALFAHALGVAVSDPER